MTPGADFEDFFSARLPDAIRVARRILGNLEEAEDAAAEGFARAYVRWSTVRRLPHRDAWVIRVVANISIDWVRRRQAPDRAAEPIVGPGDDDIAVRLALAQALRRLPEGQRRVVVLHYLAGWPVAEVARALGVSGNTVKKHSQRGLAALRGTFQVREEVAGAYGEGAL